MTIIVCIFIIFAISNINTYSLSSNSGLSPDLVYHNTTKSFKVIQFHAINEADHQKVLEFAVRGRHLYWPNLIKMAGYQRSNMAETFPGTWQCFAQLGAINYSVMRRASIYFQTTVNEYKGLRIFCFK